MIAAGLAAEAVTWGPSRKPAILHPCSFSVAPGRILGIVGANGAGKSTLLRLLYRYLRPTDGRVLLDGVDIWSLTAGEIARSVAVVLQEQPTDFALTVGEFAHGSREPRRVLWRRKRRL